MAMSYFPPLSIMTIINDVRSVRQRIRAHLYSSLYCNHNIDVFFMSSASSPVYFRTVYESTTDEVRYNIHRHTLAVHRQTHHALST